VVAGVTPGKGGTVYKGKKEAKFSKGIHVFDTLRKLLLRKSNVSIIFVPTVRC